MMKNKRKNKNNDNDNNNMMRGCIRKSQLIVESHVELMVWEWNNGVSFPCTLLP